MAGLRDEDKALFPIQSITSIVDIFKKQLSKNTEPDLALLSILVGAVENSLTCNRVVVSQDNTTIYDETKFPEVKYEIADKLYKKFNSIIKNSVDLTIYNDKYATRELVKRVSDIIWNSLPRSYYKDRAHLQSLYSYLTANKLDCFGVAFAVVAGCQLLGFKDVHLAMSEDHAWVVCGENGKETVEVTWHGKGNEDKRGQPVEAGVASRSWLYVNGQAVVCNRAMEVATIVSAINPSLSATADAAEVACVMVIILPPAIALFEEAIRSARLYYGNAHVYPYTYQGGYLYRHGHHANALASWADAADVLRNYDYSRDDGEIYKELLEIANELIPHTVRADELRLLRQPCCFGYLLRFYDGICQWEEGANTPVLHIGWARPLVNTISKFDASIRAQVIIECHEADTNCKHEDDNSYNVDLRKDTNLKDDYHNNNNNISTNNNNNNNNNNNDSCNNNNNTITNNNNNNNNINNNNNNIMNNNNNNINNKNSIKTKEKSNNARDLIASLESKVPSNPSPMHPGIQALTAACSEKILNRDYLLQGDGEPFVAPQETTSLSPPSTITPAVSSTPTAITTAIIPTPTASSSSSSTSQEILDPKINTDFENQSPRIILYSEKMKGLKDLLLAEKLNTHAISLQLTAQSQVQIGKKTRGSSDEVGLSQRKRQRH
ncbi:hypothetical protein HCN44_006412 [Aphidius gifuensis]|uniref:Menin n=1 Tax=Aphidius gifuensis TaxID=684658 RepID=A0A834XXB1_APHGI|nr:hypothetical protein HCN44_006412 [Aphidius gifuensis]